MWGFRGVQYQGEAILAAMDVEALASSKARFGFKKLFRCAGATEFDASRELNPREERVVNAALSKSKKKKERSKDVFVDVSKSEKWSPSCLDATPCVVPNSLPYRLKETAFLSP